MKKRQRIFIRIIFFLTLINLILSVLGIFLGPEETQYYIFTTFACLGMLVLLFIPAFTQRIFKVIVPSSLYVAFTLFCYCAIILGDVRDYFGTYKHWDSMLHFTSGMMLAVFGFILVNTLNNTKKGNVRLSPFFVAAAAFCFVMTVQSLWEICEFLCDDWFGLNAQTYMVTGSSFASGEEAVMLVGHEALRDTMEDFMLDGLGGLIVSIIGYIDLKKGKSSFASSRLDSLNQDESESIEADADKGKKPQKNYETAEKDS